MGRENEYNFGKLHHSETFWEMFSEYLHPEKGERGSRIKNIANVLTEKKFTIKDTEMTYRAVNHWSSLGLFDDSRPKDSQGWRKFSVIDLLWFQVLAELREFGLALDKIKKGYDALKKTKRLWEFGVALCMVRKAVYLVVFPDGMIELATRDSLAFSESLGYFTDTSYLVVNLNHCLKQLFPTVNFTPDLDSFQLSEKERTILLGLRRGDYDEIRIQMRDGDIERIDTKTNHLHEIGRLADILNKISYGEVTIKKANGKILFVEEIQKEKV